MSEPRPKFVPSAEQRALDEQIEQRRRRLEEEGRAQEIEQRESIVAKTPDRAACLSDLLPDAVGVFQRLEQKMAGVFAEIRPKVAAAPQSIACEFHPDTPRPISFDLSCQRTRERGAFSPAYEPCQRCEAEEKRQRQRRYWSRRGVPERVLEATFATYEATSDKQRIALRTVREWSLRRGNYLILIGSTGTGKGHLAASAMKSIGSGIWTEHVNMLAQLRASYHTKTTDELVRTWQDAEAFTLDEFGLSPGGRDEEPLLYQVLADRYEHRRPTIITSNLPRQELREAIGFRLLDRIREDCTEVSMNWVSHRTGQ